MPCSISPNSAECLPTQRDSTIAGAVTDFYQLEYSYQFQVSGYKISVKGVCPPWLHEGVLVEISFVINAQSIRLIDSP